MEAKEALLYEKLGDNKVRCHLCAHRCLIFDGRKGICQVRENRDGTLYTLVYGRIISQNVDPVEKKPLFHFYPGSVTYSIATPGCNARCRWCQNWEIAQMPREQHLILGREALSEQIVADAQRNGCRSLAYTYTEPTIFFEEVTTLVIPGINDDPVELRDAAQFVCGELGPATPWHLSRFFPAYKMTDVPPTPAATLQRAQEIGLEAGLHYVYLGNAPGEEETVCHHCGQLLIRRAGYWIQENHVQSDECCPACGTPVAGVRMAG